MFKAETIARWFLLRNQIQQQEDECVESISNLKLQKLLYYAQGVYLAITNSRLFEENIVAWKHGPVVEEVYNKYKVNKGNAIQVVAEAEDYEIIKSIENNKNAADTLEFVFNEYGQYSAWGLRNKTHQEKPWIETDLNGVIDENLIRDFFRDEVIEVV